MGRPDRLIRALVIAPALVVVGLVVGPTAVLSWILYALAAVMVLTSSVGFCPLYAPFGLSTCPRGAVESPKVPAGG